MNDQMAHTHRLNNRLDENNKKVLVQTKKLEEQIMIAEEHNMQQKMKSTSLNNAPDVGNLNKKKVTPNIIKKLPTISAVQKDLSINSVCSSDNGIDDVENIPEAKVVKTNSKKKTPEAKVVKTDSKKRTNNNFNEKEYSVRVQVGDKMVIDKTVKYKIKKKPRTNASNLDKEEDEAHFVFEIDRNWSLKYFRRNTVLKPRQKKI